jgi:hypothetical protein
MELLSTTVPPMVWLVADKARVILPMDRRISTEMSLKTLLERGELHLHLVSWWVVFVQSGRVDACRMIADGLDCPASTKERVCQHLIWHVLLTITDFSRMQPSYAQDLGVGSIEVCLPTILWTSLTPADVLARILWIHDEHSRFMCR